MQWTLGGIYHPESCLSRGPLSSASGTYLLRTRHERLVADLELFGRKPCHTALARCYAPTTCRRSGSCEARLPTAHIHAHWYGRSSSGFRFGV